MDKRDTNTGHQYWTIILFFYYFHLSLFLSITGKRNIHAILFENIRPTRIAFYIVMSFLLSCSGQNNHNSEPRNDGEVNEHTFCDNIYKSNITYLRCSRQQKNLEDISHFKQVEELKLHGNYSSIEPISDLKQLQQLDLKNLTATDLNPLAELANLRQLKLITNAQNLDPLRSVCGHLTTLEIHAHNANDLFFLSSCHSLEKLVIEARMATSLPSLKMLNGVTYASLKLPNLTNIENISGLSNVKHLVLLQVPISDFSFISALRKLEIISFLEMQKNYQKLRTLDFSPFLSLQNLRIMNFDRSYPHTSSFEQVRQKFPNLKIGRSIVD